MSVYQYEVRDGDRVMQFDGDLLADSTSYRHGNPRWIEFQLYRTKGGDYVLSRIGQTVVFHAPDCELVAQYHLRVGQAAKNAWSCEVCRPYADDAEVYPERIRYWAQVMKRPAAVLEALYKFDEVGTKYLTLVAQRLLRGAAEHDEGIATAYAVEHVA